MNKWLVGNGYWCPACKGTRQGEVTDAIEWQSGKLTVFRRKCAACDGEGRLPSRPDLTAKADGRTVSG